MLVQVRYVQIHTKKYDDGSPVYSVFDARELFPQSKSVVANSEQNWEKETDSHICESFDACPFIQARDDNKI